MAQSRVAHWYRRATLLLAVGFGSGIAYSDGCYESQLGTQFRQAYAPGLTAGLSAAITDPTNAEAGFREAGAALINGLGAILNGGPTGSSSSSNSSGSGA